MNLPYNHHVFSTVNIIGMRRKFRNFKLQCFKVSIIQTDLSYQLLQTAYVKGDCTENWLFCSLINYNQSLSNPLLVIIKPKLKFKVEVGVGGRGRGKKHCTSLHCSVTVAVTVLSRKTRY